VLFRSRESKLTRRVRELEQQIGSFKSTLEEWAVGINKLVAQIRKHGEEPIWTPEQLDLTKLEKG
jgi:hypothetical protein